VQNCYKGTKDNAKKKALHNLRATDIHQSIGNAPCYINQKSKKEKGYVVTRLLACS
jgi:hypothetical protein